MGLKTKGSHKKATVLKVAYEPEQDSSAITTLKSFKFVFPDEPSYEISVEDFYNPDLAAELLAAAARRYAQEHLRRASVRSLIKAVRVFCDFLPTGVDGITSVTVEHLDDFENHLAKKHPFSRTALTYYVAVNSLLKESATYAPMSEDVKYRLTRISGVFATDFKPRDGYAPSTTDTIMTAAVKDMQETIKRLPPKTFANVQTENILTHLRVGGSLPENTKDRRELAAYTGSVARIPNMIYPSVDDLVPFIVALAATSGINPTSLLNLERDCIAVQTKNSVGIKVFKPRKGDYAHEIVYVKDGGLRTPGGIIKAALDVTKDLAQRYATRKLWTYYDYRRGVQFKHESLNRKYVLNNFVTRHNLCNPDGTPLNLQLVRLRKTVKLDEYKETRGVPSLMKGHGASVAAKHYADLPQSIQTHLDALVSAMQNVVDLPTSLRTNDSPVDHSAVTGCTNMYDSPFFETGKLCSAIPGMCFACSNSVLTLDSLPAVLAYADYLVDSTTRLDPQTWLDSFASTWVRIHESILPQFTPKEIEAAELEKSAVKIPFAALEVRLC